MSDTIHTQGRQPSGEVASRGVRPDIEHTLTDYYDGNADLARALIEQLLNETRSQ